MAVSWNKNIDTALSQAKTQHKPVLLVWAKKAIPWEA